MTLMWVLTLGKGQQLHLPPFLLKQRVLSSGQLVVASQGIVSSWGVLNLAPKYLKDRAGTFDSQGTEPPESRQVLEAKSQVVPLGQQWV